MSRWPILITLTLCLLLSAARGRAQLETLSAPPEGNEAETAQSDEPEESDEIETDRDSYTPATSVVGRRQTILEASYSFVDNRRFPEGHSFPELLTRYGISDRLELRFGWNYETGGPVGPVSGVDFGDQDFEPESESRVLYGIKYETTRQSGWTPASSLIVQGFTPTYGPSTNSSVVVTETFGWTFANGWQWNSAMRFGTANAKGDAFTEWSPSSVLKIPLGENWNVHAEYFGIMSSGRQAEFSQHYVSFGGHVLLTKNLELGLRCGFGLNEQTPRFFNNVGFGWRF